MKIVFCGSSLAAIAVLESLIKKDSISIISIWTTNNTKWEDKNRSWSLTNYSSKYSIPTYLGNPNKNKQFSLDCSKSDFIVSVNCKYILEAEIINLARFGGLNLHGSLLPKYRGRCPNVWAIINGEEYAGVTAHIMEPTVDVGPILAQKKIIN